MNQGASLLLVVLSLLGASCCREPCARPPCGDQHGECPGDCPATSCAPWTEPEGASATYSTLVAPLAAEVHRAVADESFLPQERYETCWKSRVATWSARVADIQARADADGNSAIGSQAQVVIGILDQLAVPALREEIVKSKELAQEIDELAALAKP